MSRNFSVAFDDMNIGGVNGAPGVPYLHVLGDNSFGVWLNILATINDNDVLGFNEVRIGASEDDNVIFGIQFSGLGAPYEITYNHQFGADDIEINDFDTGILANTWTHLMLIRDNAALEVNCYINNVLTDSPFSFTNVPTQTEGNSIWTYGARINGAQLATGMTLSQGIYSSVAWTAAERLEVMQTGFTPRGVIFYHDMTEDVFPCRNLSGHGADREADSDPISGEPIFSTAEPPNTPYLGEKVGLLWTPPQGWSY